MKQLFVTFFISLTLLPTSLFAQENKQDIHRDTVPSESQFRKPIQAGMAAYTMMPATDFTPDPLMVKMMQINPLAVKVPQMQPAYIARWDKGGILGFYGTRGMYLGSYQGIDVNKGNWGIMLGVQQGYMPYYGQFAVMPVAMPYYKIGGARIGIDIGGALYNALSSPPSPGNPLGQKNYHGSGIIAPPIDTKPKFGSAEIPQWMEKQFDQQDAKGK